jgi:hypothetical protein
MFVIKADFANSPKIDCKVQDCLRFATPLNESEVNYYHFGFDCRIIIKFNLCWLVNDKMQLILNHLIPNENSIFLANTELMWSMVLVHKLHPIPLQLEENSYEKIIV